MGAQACCCNARQIENKQDPVTPSKLPPNPLRKQKKSKAKKSSKKTKKILKEEPIEKFFSPEINEFLEKIQPKSTDARPTTVTKEGTTGDYSNPPLLTSQTDISFVESVKPLEEIIQEGDVFYIDLPQYNLYNVNELTDREKKEISWLLLQNQTDDEEIDGYLPVRKKNRYGIKQHRWILFSTVALYVVIPHNFLACRQRIKISEIVNIYQTIDKEIFSLEIMSTEKYFLIFYANRTSDAVFAIQNLRYIISSELKELIFVRNEKEIIITSQNIDNPMDEDIVFLKIKADHGFPGEELIKTIDAYSHTLSKNKIREKMTLLITNKTIYYLDAKKALLNYMELDQVRSLTSINDKSEAIISSDEGDVWLYTLQIDLVTQDIKDIVLNQTYKVLELLTAEEKEISYNPIAKLGNKKRMIKNGLPPQSGYAEVSRFGNHLVDDIIRAI